MTTTYHNMTCGCILISEERKTRCKRTMTYFSCPVHDSRLIEKMKKCHDCENIIFTKRVRSKIAKRCPECTHIFNNKNAIIYTKKRYRRIQAEKGLIVGDNGVKPKTKTKKKTVVKKDLIIKIKIKKPIEPGNFFGCLNFKEICKSCIRPWFKCKMMKGV